MSKTLETRIQYKHDTLENWEKDTVNFSPLKGELLVYNVSSDDVMLKVGDDSTLPQTLPYVYLGSASDSSNEETTLTTIDLPTSPAPLTYNGNNQKPDWSTTGYDVTTMLIDETEKTDAGTYYASFTPLEGYCWSDTKSTATRSVAWTINRATPTLTLGATEITLSDMSVAEFVSITYNGDSQLSCFADNSDYVTTSITDLGLSLLLETAEQANTCVHVVSSKGTNYSEADTAIKVYCKHVHDYQADPDIDYSCEDTVEKTCTDKGCNDTIQSEGGEHTKNDDPIVVESTCVEYGTLTYTCTICGEEIVENMTQLGSHSMGEWKDYDDSIHIKYCINDGCAYTEQEDHNYEGYSPAIPPTCSTAGKMAGYWCSICNHTFQEASKIPATGNHTYGAWTKVDSFQHSRTCSVCNEATEYASHTMSQASYSYVSTTEHRLGAGCTAGCGYTEIYTEGHSVTTSHVDNGNGTHTSTATCVKCKGTLMKSTMNHYTTGSSNKCDVCGATMFVEVEEPKESTTEEEE